MRKKQTQSLPKRLKSRSNSLFSHNRIKNEVDIAKRCNVYLVFFAINYSFLFYAGRQSDAFNKIIYALHIIASYLFSTPAGASVVAANLAAFLIFWGIGLLRRRVG